MTAQSRSTNVLHHAAHFGIGFLSRPCCSIPATLALLGAGGTGIAVAIAPYRLWFMFAAAIFFTASFYWNFIRNRNPAGMAVWSLSFALAAGFWIVPPILSSPAYSAPAMHEDSTMTQSTLSPIEGMACQACARRIERVLAKLDGVEHAAVDLKQKQAIVSHDSTALDRGQLIVAIRDAGFRVPD